MNKTEAAILVVEDFQYVSGHKDITVDTPIESLQLDSLDCVDLAMRLEDRFQVAVDEDTFQDYMKSSVGDVVDNLCSLAHVEAV